jgi:hypothetical protein
VTKNTQETTPDQTPEDKTEETRLDRRSFIAGVSATGVALGSAATKAGAQTADTEHMAAAPPSEAQRVADVGTPDEYSADEHDQYFVENPGSDYMIDVLRSLNIDYVATNPGSSFRGLQESLVNYGGNNKPELLTCTHEEQAVAMGHGYYKVAGKPRSITLGATAYRLCSSPVTTSMRHIDALASSGRIRQPTACGRSATTSSGTTRRSRCRILPSPWFVPTSCR